MQHARYLSTHRSEGKHAHRIFPSNWPKELSTFFYLPIEKSAPTTILVGSPSFTNQEIGIHDLTNPMVKCSVLESPKPDNSQH
jgi:hypothetical protein